MIAILTPDQIKNLSPEEQEAIIQKRLAIDPPKTKTGDDFYAELDAMEAELDVFIAERDARENPSN